MQYFSDHDRRVLLTTGEDDDAARRLWGSDLVSRLGEDGAPAPAQSERLDSVLLVVESGPDAGLVVSLPRGRSGIGRGENRVRLEDLGVSRHHADLDISPEGIRITAHQRTRIDGRPRSAALLDETSRVQIGSDILRILPRPPALARPPETATRDWDTVCVPGQPPPPYPIVPAIGSIAPLLMGCVLMLITGSPFMLIFGCLGLVTGGVTVADAVTRRRRYRRHGAALARAQAAALSAAYPSSGRRIAALRRPENTPTSLAIRLGQCRRPSMPLRSNGTDTTRRPMHIRVDSLPALCCPAREATIWLVGTPDQCAHTLRNIALAWLPTPTSSLAVSPTPHLPAFILALPNVRLNASAPQDQLLTRTTEDGTTHVRTATSLESAYPRPGDVLVDLASSTMTTDAADALPIRFEPDLLSKHAFEKALTGLAASACTQKLPPTGRCLPLPQTRPTLEATLGHHTTGPVSLDLVTQGPHALIAGTTGAGKSVLLSTWITDLTHRYRPDELRLVLLDFKGGSTFDAFAQLPHVEDIVTNLDPEATNRVIEGINEELSNRERLLRTHHVSDITDLAPDHRPARILVAVDEFRLLAESVPDILDDLIRAATVGRSLGLHLILATQRPQGIISPHIRANVSLTLCLRLTSEAESMDLIGAPDAARISPQDPGACLYATGTQPPRPFHVAPPSDGPVRTSQPLLVGPTCADITTAAPSAPQPQNTTTPNPPEPHTAPTPSPFIASALPEHPLRVATATAPAAARLGLAAHPNTLTPWTHHPYQDGSLAIIASPGAQRKNQATALLRAISNTPWGRACLVLDADQAVTDTTGLGLVLTPEHGPDVDEALKALAQGDSPSPHHPAVLIMVATHAWLGDGTHPDQAARETAISALAASGRCPIIAIGGRDLLTSRLLAHLPLRLYQPFGMGFETRALWPRLKPCAEVPGRGVLLGPGHPTLGRVVQTVVAVSAHLPVGGLTGTSMAAGASVVPSPGPKTHLDHRHPTPPVPRHREIGTAKGRSGWARLPIKATGSEAFALRGPHLIGVSWEPTSNAAVILGPPSSGRTTTLGRWALTCKEHTRWVLPAHTSQTPHSDLGQAPHQCDGWPDPLQEPNTWWLIDDVERLNPGQHLCLTERVRAGGRVIVTATSIGSAQQRLSWWHQVDQAGSIFLLGPVTPEAVPLGWRIPVDPQAPPGRGWCLPRGESSPVRVQVITDTREEQDQRGASSTSR